MFGIFNKKKIICENCKRPLDKYHVFDPTPWVKDLHFEKIKLCTDCMLSKYKKYLNDFTGKAVIIEPMKNYIAFPYYTFDEILEGDYWPKEGVIELRNFVEQGGNCIKCRKPTNYLLCSPDIYQNNPIKDLDVKNCTKDYFCADCLCDRLENIIIDKNIFFNAIHPIMDGDGVATSFNP